MRRNTNAKKDRRAGGGLSEIRSGILIKRLG